MREPQDNRSKAIIFAVLLHVILATVLILGIEFSEYRPLSGQKVEIIEAELVTEPVTPRVDPAIEARQRELEEQQRKEQLEIKQRQEAEALRLKELEQKKQAAAEAQKRAEAEKLRKTQEEAKQKAEVEKQRKAQEEERLKTEAAKQKAEQEAQRKAEAEARKKAEAAERQKKAEEEARRKLEAEQEAREKALQEALRQEARERELSPLRAAYSAAISQKITQNWLKPPGISDTLKCEVKVAQLPDGTVTSARITQSSGNPVFDDSVLKAIYKAAPLPQAPSPEVFDPELVIGFCSTGNLC